MGRNRDGVRSVHFEDPEEQASPEGGEVGDLVEPPADEHEVHEIYLAQE